MPNWRFKILRFWSRYLSIYDVGILFSRGSIIYREFWKKGVRCLFSVIALCKSNKLNIPELPGEGCPPLSWSRLKKLSFKNVLIWINEHFKSEFKNKYKQYISFALYADDMLLNLPLRIIHIFLWDLPACAFFLVNEKYKRVMQFDWYEMS